MLIRKVDHIFSNYSDVAEFLDDYYKQYREVPTLEFVQEKFPDFDTVKTAGPVEHYLDKCESEYMSNEVEKVLLGAAENLPKLGAARIIEGIEKKLAKIRNTAGTSNALDITDVDNAVEYYEGVRSKVEAGGGTAGIKTGIQSIDYFYPTGMAPGHKVTLIGWPSKGKSWFAGYLAIQAWLQGYKPMLISLEMSPQSMRDRLYTMMGEGLFTMSGLARGDLRPDDLREWGKKVMESRQKFYVVPGEKTGAFTPKKLQGKVEQYKPDMVVVDYLQLMSDDGNTKDAIQRNMNLSRELKNIASSNNIVVVDITAATAKDVEDREKPPTMAQVAWSKAIEYDADLAMAVHRHEASNIVEIVCRKNRHGDMFATYLEWDMNKGIIREHAGSV